MKEQVLIDYLQNKITVEILAADLKGSQKRTSHDVTRVYIDQLGEETKFIIKREHLIRLCNEALAGNLNFEDLNTIAFTLLTTEYIQREEADEIMEEVLIAWDSPEIGFPFTVENMKKWKILLETGVDTFDLSELKQKKKNGR
jgi:hypothetical protein